MEVNNLNEELERYIEFCVDGKNYAFPLLLVREVISIPLTTQVPKAPPYFVGVMNLRGQVISIIDLRKKLNVPIAENNLDEAVIIIEENDVRIGIVVDSILRVIQIKNSEIQELPELKAHVNAKFVKGVVKRADGLTVVIDIVNCLDMNDVRIIKNQEAA